MKKLKDVVKKNPEPAKAANVNPGQLGQYSAQNQISEGSLEQYLLAKGINPKFVSKNTKIAHSKSLPFLKWKREHMTEDRTMEVSPTQSRLNILNKSQSTHKEIKTPKGPGKQEGSQTTQLTPEAVGDKQDSTVKAWKNRYLLKNLLKYLGITEAKTTQGTALDKFRQVAAERAKKHAEIEKKQSKDGSGMTAAIDRLQKHLNKEEVLPVLQNIRTKEKVKRDKEIVDFRAKHMPVQLPKTEEINVKEDTNPNSPKEAGVAKEIKNIRKRESKNKGIWEDGDLMGDPKAAEISPADGANGGRELAEKKRQMSKSARMIKAIYKKKGMVKEDLFDHEKEDKSVKTYGKKPKFDKSDKDDSLGEKKPAAAATLTGGTTLTGSKRDDIEIDPMMRNRPGQPDVTKKDDKKKDDKKEDKKKDK